MGLDQYLYARKYISDKNYGRKPDGEYFSEPNEEFDKILEVANLTKEELGGDYSSIYLEVKVGQWRKANAIHQWFVSEVQNGEDDCGEYYVSRDQLIELRNLCQQVIDNPEDGEEILPTQGGFFFGDTAYDEWYLASLKDTIGILDKLLNNEKFSEWDIKYSSSW